MINKLKLEIESIKERILRFYKFGDHLSVILWSGTLKEKELELKQMEHKQHQKEMNYFPE